MLWLFFSYYLIKCKFNKIIFKIVFLFFFRKNKDFNSMFLNNSLIPKNQI